MFYFGHFAFGPILGNFQLQVFSSWFHETISQITSCCEDLGTKLWEVKAPHILNLGGLQGVQRVAGGAPGAGARSYRGWKELQEGASCAGWRWLDVWKLLWRYIANCSRQPSPVILWPPDGLLVQNAQKAHFKNCAWILTICPREWKEQWWDSHIS